MASTLMDADGNEHYIRHSDPKKPTYYIIRHWDPAVGLFAIFGIVLNHVRYALSKGWIPVVDMQNYPNAYLAPEKLGKENSWEYYFEQPFRIGLEQAYNGENVILSCASPPKFEDVDIYSEKNHDTLIEWRMFVKLGLLKVKPERMQEILAVREKLFAPSDRVLGVLLRGTDYITRRPHGHYIPPPLNLLWTPSSPSSKNGIATKFSLRRRTKILRRISKVFSGICA